MAAWHDFEYMDSVRIRALGGVVSPDMDSFVQSVFEWYSKEYHTPLHTVSELSLDYVLTAYYRAYYRNMDSEDRHNEAIWLLETPEERSRRKVTDKSSEEDFMRKAMEHNAKQQAKLKSGKGVAAGAKKIEELLNKMKAKAEAESNEDGIGRRVSLPDERPLRVKEMQEISFKDDLPKPPKGQLRPEMQPPPPVPGEPEEVTVKYMSEAEFEAELDKPVGPPPGKPKGKL